MKLKKTVSVTDVIGYLEFISTQEFLCGRAGHADGWAARDDDGGAGEHLSGDETHAVTHGSQIRCVTETRTRTQTLTDGKCRL